MFMLILTSLKSISGKTVNPKHNGKRSALLCAELMERDYGIPLEKCR
jgi:hypothetical protein